MAHVLDVQLMTVVSAYSVWTSQSLVGLEGKSNAAQKGSAMI